MAEPLNRRSRVIIQGSDRAPSLWLADALAALAGVDEEIAEENLPEIGGATKTEAERLLADLARHPQAPTVYPTQDAEIAIHFKSSDLPDSVVHSAERQWTGGLLCLHGRDESARPLRNFLGPP